MLCVNWYHFSSPNVYNTIYTPPCSYSCCTSDHFLQASTGTSCIQFLLLRQCSKARVPCWLCVCARRKPAWDFLESWFILGVHLACYVKAKVAEAAACLLCFQGPMKGPTPICTVHNSFRDLRALKYGAIGGSLDVQNRDSKVHFL